jgi:hypothetical protein
MSAVEFNCPKCGGIIEIKNKADVTMHCPFCNSLVQIPEEFRQIPPAFPSFDFKNFETNNPDYQQAVKRRKIVIFIAVLFFFMILGGIYFLVMVFNNAQTSQPSQSSLPAFTMMAPPTSVPQALATATTPSYAYSINSWGGSGIGEGLFNDPRYIAVDGNGNVYVGDYQNGRIQRFNSDGEYQTSWSASDADETIYGLAVTYDSKVFVSVGNYLKKFDGITGESLASIEAYEGGAYGDLATTIDGDLIAVWYQGRYGIYNSSDEGHRVDLVLFDSDLIIRSTAHSFISAITGGTQTDVELAVDGNGTIYAASESRVYVFTKEGKFVDQFGPGEGEAGAFHRADGIAVDGQGRVFVVDGDQVHVFSPDYSFIADIQSEESLQMVSIDPGNHIWGLARDKVIEYLINNN